MLCKAENERVLREGLDRSVEVGVEQDFIERMSEAFLTTPGEMVKPVSPKGERTGRYLCCARDGQV